MRKAKLCYMMSNGTCVKCGDVVKVYTLDMESYIGAVVDLNEDGIDIEVDKNTEYIGMYFRDILDVELVGKSK